METLFVETNVYALRQGFGFVNMGYLTRII